MPDAEVKSVAPVAAAPTAEPEPKLEPKAPAVESSPGIAEAKPDAPAQDEDAREFTIEDETYTLADLKQAAKHIQKSVQVRKQAEQQLAAVEAFKKGVNENLGGTVLDILSAQAGGNREAGWQALVAFACDVVNEAFELEQEPAEKKEARKWAAEAERHKSQAEKYRQQEAERAQAEAESAAFLRMHKAITEATKAGGIDSDEDTLAEVAEILLKARESGFDMTATQAVEAVKRGRRKRVQSTLTKDAKIEDLPPELLKRVNEHFIKQANPSAGKGPSIANPATPATKTSRFPDRKVVV